MISTYTITAAAVSRNDEDVCNQQLAVLHHHKPTVLRPWRMNLRSCLVKREGYTSSFLDWVEHIICDRVGVNPPLATLHHRKPYSPVAVDIESEVVLSEKEAARSPLCSFVGWVDTCRS